MDFAATSGVVAALHDTQCGLQAEMLVDERQEDMFRVIYLGRMGGVRSSAKVQGGWARSGRGED